MKIELFKFNGQINVFAMSKDHYTHFIQIEITQEEETKRFTLPIDPTDNTLAATLDPALITALGEHAKEFMEKLSTELREQIGAKQIMVVPIGSALTDYILPINADFKRLRYAKPEHIATKSADILAAYPEIQEMLDKTYYFTATEKALLADFSETKRYAEVDDILGSARFLTSKQTEYKEEDLQGKASRIKSEFILPITMQNEEKEIHGIIRALKMGNGFIYLSDEVMDQDIVELDKFTGSTIEEKKSAREKFLLAYLLQHANQILSAKIEKTHCIIMIAASGREHLYAASGFRDFSGPSLLSEFAIQMKFGPKGKLLEEMQDNIRKIKFTSDAVSPAKKGLFALSLKPVTVSTEADEEKALAYSGPARK